MNKVEMKDRVATELINELLVELNNEIDGENKYGIMYLEDQREFYVFKNTYEDDNSSFMLRADGDEDITKDYQEVLEGIVKWVDYDNLNENKIKTLLPNTYEFVLKELNTLENMAL